MLPIEIEGNSLEDPKFFKRDGELCISWVDADPLKFNGVVKFARYRHESFEEITQPDLPGNDGSKLEKNWVFFGSWCLYQTQPEQIIYDLTTGMELRSPGPR